jgi:hypothetical protein
MAHLGSGGNGFHQLRVKNLLEFPRGQMRCALEFGGPRGIGMRKALSWPLVGLGYVAGVFGIHMVWAFPIALISDWKLVANESTLILSGIGLFLIPFSLGCLVLANAIDPEVGLKVTEARENRCQY